MQLMDDGTVKVQHPQMGEYYFCFEKPMHNLFTKNETNTERLYNQPNASPYIKDCFRDLRKSGHVIGFHPGYSTYNNLDELIIEKKTLEAALGEPVLEGRQHYLRFRALLFAFHQLHLSQQLPGDGTGR